MLTFNLVSGGKATINSADISAFEYKHDEPDGTIRIKYAGSPEMHIPKMPRVPKPLILGTMLWNCDTYHACDMGGEAKMLLQFQAQTEHMKRRVLETTQGNIGLEIVALPAERHRSGETWVPFRFTFFLISRLGVDQKGWLTWCEGMDDDRLNSFLKEPVVDGMPNIPWFGPGDSNPFEAKWSIFGSSNDWEWI